MREFFESGKASKVTHYIAGHAEGGYQELGEQGTVRVKGSFKNDQKDGIWIRFGEKGNEITRSVFKQGKLVTGEDTFEQ